MDTTCIRPGFYEGRYNGRSYSVERRPDELDGKMMWFAIIYPVEGGHAQCTYLEPTWTKKLSLKRIEATLRACPQCGSPLDDTGPFDGREAATGVNSGHEGFGGTFVCSGNGHSYAFIQGGLVPASRVLTVVEVG